MGTDGHATAGPPWSVVAFLDAISSAEDRDRAQFIFDCIEADRKSGSYFWLGERPRLPGPPWSVAPRGGIFPHAGGLHYAPMSLMVSKSGVLQGRGAWKRYGPSPSGHSASHCRTSHCGWRPEGCKHDKGFAELAAFLGQDYLGAAPRFRLDRYDVETLWDIALRTTFRINGREYEPGAVASHIDSPLPDNDFEFAALIEDPDDRLYRRKFGRGLNYAERKAVEMRAVEVTRQHFEAELGYATKDVGDTYSYDIHATKDNMTIRIEVKGTITDGSSVTLTANEVDLHEAEYPNNAFALVRNIILERSGDQPVAVGGDLVPPEMPWRIDRGRLKPTEYRYLTGY